MVKLGKPGRTKGSKISILTATRARNLYLLHGLTSQQVAEKVGLTPTQIYNLAFREGWSKMEKRGKDKAYQNIEKKLIETIDSAISQECDEHALAGLKRVGEAVESDSPFAAKDFLNWSSGVKNLVGIARTVRGLELGNGLSSSQTNISVFLARGETIGSAPKQVTQVVAEPVQSIETEQIKPELK